MSRARQPRPYYRSFQTLMDKVDASSISWWAEATDACCCALIEYKMTRQRFHSGKPKTARDIADLERWGQNLDHLAKRLGQLELEHGSLPMS